MLLRVALLACCVLSGCSVPLVKSVQLSVDSGDGGGTVSADNPECECDSTFAALDQRITDLENAVTSQDFTLVGYADSLNTAEDRIASLEDQVEDLNTEVNALQTEVDSLDGGSSSGLGVTDAAGISQHTGSSSGSSSWERITADDVTVYAEADGEVMAWCTLTNGSTSSAEYRVIITSEDGTWTEDSEVTGDSPYAGYSSSYAESITAPGFWTVPDDGYYVVQCQGIRAAAYDLTLFALSLPTHS